MTNERVVVNLGLHAEVLISELHEIENDLEKQYMLKSKYGKALNQPIAFLTKQKECHMKKIKNIQGELANFSSTMEHSKSLLAELNSETPVAPLDEAESLLISKTRNSAKKKRKRKDNPEATIVSSQEKPKAHKSSAVQDTRFSTHVVTTSPILNNSPRRTVMYNETYTSNLSQTTPRQYFDLPQLTVYSPILAHQRKRK
ncbi:hypothetical protein PCE1_003500 [Barthelona sp. PCE]